MNKLSKFALISALVIAGGLYLLKKPVEAQDDSTVVRLASGPLVWSPKSNLLRYSYLRPDDFDGKTNAASVEVILDVRAEAVTADGLRKSERFNIRFTFMDSVGSHQALNLQRRGGAILVHNEDTLVGVLGRDNEVWDFHTVHATFMVRGLKAGQSAPNIGVADYDAAKGEWKEYQPAKDQLKAKPRN